MAVKIKGTGRKGQSIVETALVLPIIILILMGIIDFGFLFNNYLIISNAAREGARSAAVGKADSDIVDDIMEMTDTLEEANLSVDITPDDTSRVKGEGVKVTVEYDYEFLTPVIGSILPNPMHLTAETTMRIE